MEKVIECIDLEKKYFLFDKDYKVIPWLFTKNGCKKEITTLTNINLTINKGDVIGFIGKNGAGKSTLMKIIAGITMHTKGHLEVNGKVNSLINLSAGFNKKYTGRQNIYYKGLLMGMSRENIDEIIDDIVEFCELGEYFDLPLYMYSSGMSARLGFALAVFAEHDILIVDEVFAVGDKAFRAKSAKKMEELFKSGKSIIFASHSDSQIKKFCNRAIFIDENRIVMDGKVDDILKAYNKKYFPESMKKNKSKNKKNPVKKKFNNVESKYYKEINLLRINANIPKEKADKCELYLDGKYIGKLIQNIYVNNAGTGSGSKKWNSFFTKVINKFDFKKVEIRYYYKNELVTKSNYDILKINSLPYAYISSSEIKTDDIVDRQKEEKFLNSLNQDNFNRNIKLLSIECSGVCNCRCEYCLVGQAYESIERTIISKEVRDEAINIIQRFPSIGTVMLNGLGEPLLYKEFASFCEEIKEKTKVKKILFHTNAMFLTEELVDRLVKIPIKFDIRISIDGKSENENSDQRIGYDFELVKKNIKYLLKKTELKERFNISIQNLLLDDVGDNYIPEFLLNKFGNLKIDSHKTYYFPQLSEYKLKENNIVVLEKKVKNICKRCFNQATIRSNGDVIRCHWDATCEMVMGNILHTPFEEIWNGKEYQYIRDVMKDKYEIESLPKSCQMCHVMNNSYLLKK